MITIREIQHLSSTRARRWHKGEPTWSLLEWTGAMCGEAGESANFAKKVKRIMEGLQNISDRGVELEDAKRQSVKEAADAFLYGVLVADAAGFDFQDIITEVFNAKSREYGFPERLPCPNDNNGDGNCGRAGCPYCAP